MILFLAGAITSIAGLAFLGWLFPPTEKEVLQDVEDLLDR